MSSPAESSAAHGPGKFPPPTKVKKQYAGTCMVDGCLDPFGDPRVKKAGTFCETHKWMHIFFMEQLDPPINRHVLLREQDDKVARTLGKEFEQFPCVSEYSAFNGQPWRETLKGIVIRDENKSRCNWPGHQYKLCKERCQPHVKTIDPEGLVFNSSGQMMFPCILVQPPDDSEHEGWRQIFEPSTDCGKACSRMYSLCNYCRKYWKRKDRRSFDHFCYRDGQIITWALKDQLVGSVAKLPLSGDSKGEETDVSDSDTEALETISTT